MQGDKCTPLTVKHTVTKLKEAIHSNIMGLIYYMNRSHTSSKVNVGKWGEVAFTLDTESCASKNLEKSFAHDGVIQVFMLTIFTLQNEYTLSKINTLQCELILFL